MTKVAQIIYQMYRQLGEPPKEWLPRTDALQIVRSILAKYDEHMKQSDQNQILEHFDFTTAANSIQHDISDEIGKGMVAWVERGCRNSASPLATKSNQYVPVRVVNLASLSSKSGNESSEQKVAIYGNRDGEVFLRLRFSEKQDFRVWFDPDTPYQYDWNDTKKAVDSTRLPANFNELVLWEGIKAALPLIRVRIAKYERLNNEVIMTQSQDSAYRSLEHQATQEIGQRASQFDSFAYRTRSAQSNVNRERKFRNNLYSP